MRLSRAQFVTSCVQREATCAALDANAASGLLREKAHLRGMSGAKMEFPRFDNDSGMVQ